MPPQDKQPEQEAEKVEQKGIDKPTL